MLVLTRHCASLCSGECQAVVPVQAKQHSYRAEALKQQRAQVQAHADATQVLEQQQPGDHVLYLAGSPPLDHDRSHGLQQGPIKQEQQQQQSSEAQQQEQPQEQHVSTDPHVVTKAAAECPRSLTGSTDDTPIITSKQHGMPGGQNTPRNQIAVDSKHR